MEEEKWITKKELIMPIVAIVAFLILLGGAAYAFYPTMIGATVAPENISNANLVLPKGCVFLAEATNCLITGNLDNTSTLNRADNYISTGEMSEASNNYVIARSSCYLHIGVKGSEGCKCTYNVNIDSFLPTTGYNTNSIVIRLLENKEGTLIDAHKRQGSLAFKGVFWSHYDSATDNGNVVDINSIVNTSSNKRIVIANWNDANNVLSVGSDGNTVYTNFGLHVYAVNYGPQDSIASTQYSYILRATPTCKVS